MFPSKYCDWCGNTSGKENQYGGCISCGGPLTVRYIHKDRYIIPGSISVDEMRRCMGITGSTVGRVAAENLYPTTATYKGIPVNEIPPEMLQEYFEFLRIKVYYD